MRIDKTKILKPRIVLPSIILFGSIFPFIPYLVVIEFFFLMIPFVIIFFISILILIISLFLKEISFKKTMFIFSLLPIFIFSQLLSTTVINKVQKYRSELIIKKIENIKSLNGTFPENYKISLGIKYFKIEDEQNYIIRYSRGFMVTEKYYHNEDKWRNYGWND
ncbi:MAG: hypothetical protein K8R54_01225 [Bacteroidales bacterium]|nr:hypothetical protein [Bacteroidales bacterium]